MAIVRLTAVNSAIDGSAADDATKSQIKSAVAAATAPLPDTWIYRIVVIALGLAIFVPLVPLAIGDKASAQLLLPIATTALGALAGLLAPSPASGN
jgi:hypothetical protein